MIDSDGHNMPLEQNNTVNAAASLLAESTNFDPIGHTLIGIYLTVMAVLGVTGNTLVLVTFWRKRELLSPTYAIVLALTICDLIMSVAGTPFSAASSLAQGWLFGSIGCKWEAFITFFLGLAGLYLLAAISVDRYIIILKPCSINCLTYRGAYLMIAFCVVISLLFSLMPLTGWNSYTLEAANTSCSVNWKGRTPGDTSFIITIFLACFVLPVAVMVCCYTFLFIKVREVTQILANGPGSNRKVTNHKNAMEMKLAWMIGVMLGAYLVSWTPYAIVSLWAAIGDPDSIPVLAALLPAVLAKSATVWNPIIYVGMNKKFRQALGNVLPCMCLTQVIAPVVSAPSEDANKTIVGELKRTSKISGAITTKTPILKTPKAQQK
ncbi:unnamed protein product [Owenia fusiformis]|uniref:Uncharacterized protein n=1 Tax=Owenia fusiformis TaxID=6347 RepID=A0A8J1TF30_OWEFU|nr:unnamed protein product [Owenia fusiformis]